MHGILIGNIKHMVEKGNRMGRLSDGGPNPIPDIAYEDYRVGGSGIEYMGAPSSDNIDMQFIVHKPVINITPGKVDIRATPRKPDIEYIRGSVRTYMMQYPKVTITPPAIDMSV
jgi:hypothetical protein